MDAQLNGVSGIFEDTNRLVSTGMLDFRKNGVYASYILLFIAQKVKNSTGDPLAMNTDLQRFRETPLVGEPFQYLIVPQFVKPTACAAINADFPKIAQHGSFPVGEQKYGAAFGELLDELRGPEMRKAFEGKFGIDLAGRPTMITVRGRCSPKDGRIHNDSETKIITVLIYMNPKWEEPGGRLRLLRSADNLDDVIAEVPPVEGTLLAFLRSDNSFHGHKSFSGERRVIQLNWVTSQSVVDRETKRHRLSAWTKKLTGAFRS